MNKLKSKCLQSTFKQFVDSNKFRIIIIFSIYSSVTIAINLANYPYIDDIGRQLEGYTGFAAHYSRYLSELVATIIQGSRHLTESGLTTAIISAFILSVTSTFVLYIFFGNVKIKWLTAISSVFIGLNPWFLEALSFRFDSPFLSLSLLIIVIPFFFWKSTLKRFYLIGTFCMFLMCNAYQASSGIFILITLTLVFIGVTTTETLKSLWSRILIAMSAFLSGLFLYFIQVKIFPPIFVESTELGNLLNIPKNMVTNTYIYLDTIWTQSNKTWLILFILTFILLGFNCLLSSFKPRLETIGYILIYIVLGAILSYGAYVIFPISYAAARPRYAYGIGVFIGIAMILLSQKSAKVNWLKIKTLVVSLLAFYLLSFCFTYAAALKEENDYFTSKSIILGTSLNNVANEKNSTVKINRFVGDSPIFINTAKNYPILSSLIISQSNVSWDYIMRFNSITNLQLNFELYDESKINFKEIELIESTLTYDIFERDNQIFVQMK